MLRTTALFFALTAMALLAQTDRGVIRGVVKDSSGAFVPNTQIAITEIQTNIQVRSVISDSNGNYEAPDLKPTLYRVKADAKGFRAFIADDVLLDAGQVRRVDVTLEVGSATESITVDAGAALIQTDTVTLAEELDTAKKYPPIARSITPHSSSQCLPRHLLPFVTLANRNPGRNTSERKLKEIASKDQGDRGLREPDLALDNSRCYNRPVQI